MSLLTWVAFNPPLGHCNHFAPSHPNPWLYWRLTQTVLRHIQNNIQLLPPFQCLSGDVDGAMWRPQSSDSPTAFLHRPKNALTCEDNHKSPLSPPSLRVRGHGQVLFWRRKPEICWKLLATRRLIWPPNRSPGHPSFGQWTHHTAPFLDLPDICVLWRHRRLAKSHNSDCSNTLTHFHLHNWFKCTLKFEFSLIVGEILLLSPLKKTVLFVFYCIVLKRICCIVLP